MHKYLQAKLYVLNADMLVCVDVGVCVCVCVASFFDTSKIITRTLLIQNITLYIIHGTKRNSKT